MFSETSLCSQGDRASLVPGSFQVRVPMFLPEGRRVCLVLGSIKIDPDNILILSGISSCIIYPLENKRTKNHY